MNQLFKQFVKKAVQVKPAFQTQKMSYNFGVGTTASTIVMVKPVDFHFNEQTALDNEFMHSNIDAKTANRCALQEFEGAVEKVRQTGVNVIIFDKSLHPEMKNDHQPDAVFPNNWFSTNNCGTVFLYPMLAENRQIEKNSFRYIAEYLSKDFKIENVQNFEYKDQILEGTGSLIIDKIKNRVYCSISKRADKDIFYEWCKLTGYEGHIFEGHSSTDHQYYHTNVLLSIGEHFAVFCAESIQDLKIREKIVSKLSEDRDLVLITKEQVEKNFCGNILELESDIDRSKHIFMSQSAYDGFTKDQMDILKKHGNVVGIPLNMIEQVGGGSMRCMMAEIFLEKKQKN